MKYDVISYQFGLHDLGFDTERISVELYSALLTNITADLVAVQRARGSKLLWVKTTPVPTVPTYGPLCTSTNLHNLPVPWMTMIFGCLAAKPPPFCSV